MISNLKELFEELLFSRGNFGLNFQKEAERLKQMGATDFDFISVLKELCHDYGFTQIFKDYFVRDAQIHFEYKSAPSPSQQAYLAKKFSLSRQRLNQIIGKQEFFWMRWRRQKPKLKRELYYGVLEIVMEKNSD